MGEPPDLAELHDQLGSRSQGSRVAVQRVYGCGAPIPGRRVLVDRLWPRGLSKAELAVDWWAKQLAPSAELRRWFAHDPERWDEFQSRFRAELEQPDAARALDRLEAMAGEGSLVLLFGARDLDRNQAVVLQKLLVERLRRSHQDKG